MIARTIEVRNEERLATLPPERTALVGAMLLSVALHLAVLAAMADLGRAPLPDVRIVADEAIPVELVIQEREAGGSSRPELDAMLEVVAASKPQASDQAPAVGEPPAALALAAPASLAAVPTETV